jgi:hypothetical protein
MNAIMITEEKEPRFILHSHTLYKLRSSTLHKPQRKVTLSKIMSSDFDGSNFISNAHGALRRQQPGGLDATFDSAITTSTTKTKRKRESSLRKAPGAPKRFKSSYILFFMAQREEIKRELGSKASVSLQCGHPHY